MSKIIELFKHIGFYPVIAVHKTDILSLGYLNTRFPSRNDASIFFVYHLDPFIFGCIEVANLRATVGRPVVDQDDFEVLISLLDEALDAVPHIPFNPVNRDNNTN